MQKPTTRRSASPSTSPDLIKPKEQSDLQLFLEAFFSPIAILAWTFLAIALLYGYFELFVFKP